MIAARQFTFLWPSMLALLILVPALVALYVRLGRRKRHPALHHPGLGMTAAAGTGTEAGWRRTLAGTQQHAPALLMLLGVTAMLMAVARPQAIIMLPARLDAVILAVDTSGSMNATDIKPSRMEAAKSAAKSFVMHQPGQVRIGVVTMAATAALVLSPTDDRGDIINAIDRVKIQPGTALGSGIVIALATLLPNGGLDVQKILNGADSLTTRMTRDWARQSEINNFKPVPPGSNEGAAIVLLSDGQSNTGPELLDAAKLAAERGVRIYTVGVGTPEGTTLTEQGWSMRVRLDEEALRKVATLTRGEYYRAGNATDLKAIYDRLSSRLTLGKGRTTEITAVFVAAGAALALIGGLLSMLRAGRIL
jgi:Ca-activated chloride channel family protein